MIDTTKVPKHVAIIMDGNRRWAKAQGLSAVGGHTFVVDKVIEPIIQHAGDLGIKYLTLWAFSTENWKRDPIELSGIMELFKRGVMEKLGALINKGARLRFIGDLSKFSKELQVGMEKAVEKSKDNKGINVTFALNYGGRDEIIRALNRMVEDRKSSDRSPRITQGSELESYLDTVGMPDPDLIIRTGGEQRMSGFMMWQAQYSEFYFTETLMPDLTTTKFDEAIEEYQSRQRRFGK
ncbi:MAG: polyprenyl diphosphate synthase [Microgenomates group bacterium]